MSDPKDCDNPEATGAADAVERADEIAELYFDQLRQGAAPAKESILAAYPDLAPLLTRKLAFAELMHASAGAGNLSAAPGAKTAPEIPSCLGRYIIQGILGQGASAVVYRARDPHLERDVALKVLHPDRHMEPKSLLRFEREARTAAQLGHPNIVRLYEAGAIDGRLFMSMELVEGETLKSRLEREPVPFREAADLVRQAAIALDCAHNLGIIHRDVKPSNILLQMADSRLQIENQPGRSLSKSAILNPQFAIPKVTDFGLARRDGHPQTTITDEGSILGTMAYMPPEQAAGRTAQADRRGDVYSLGAILYELLTRRTPLPTDGLPSSQIYHILYTEPRPPSTLNLQVPRDLDTICAKALAKDPGERFATAALFAAELQAWLDDRPLNIRPPTWRDRLRRWARRNPLAAKVAGVMLVLLVAVGAILGSVAWTAQVRESLEAETRAEVEYRALLVQARERLYQPRQGRHVETIKILESIAKPRSRMPPSKVERLDLEAKSLYAAALGVPDITVEEANRVNMPSAWHQIWWVALHPDGNAITIGTHLRPIRWKRGDRLQLPEGLDKERPRPRVAYTPDGNHLVFAPAEGGVELWDGSVSRTEGKWKPGVGASVLGIGFSRDGKHVRVCCVDGLVQTLSVPECKNVGSWTNKELPGITAAAFNTDATALAVGNATGRVIFCKSDGSPVHRADGTLLDYRQHAPRSMRSPGPRIAGCWRSARVTSFSSGTRVQAARLSGSVCWVLRKSATSSFHRTAAGSWPVGAAFP
jgi:hypothetical protein